MKYRNLIGLIFLIGVYSCTDNQQVDTNIPNQSEKYSDIHIKNGPRQGFEYFDLMKNRFMYIYTTMTITNDSKSPVNLEISLSKNYTDSLKSKVFLLPRTLTPESQHFDNSMSKELKLFLDRDLDTPISLNKIIYPNENCIVTFGTLTNMKYFLTDIKYRAPSNIALKTSVNNPSILSLQLNLDDGFKDTINDIIIPCGQITFKK